uniref:Piwi protein 3 n=1 Tax=Pleurobrachia bachei TaxID=34499 RepID=U3KTQ2_PLEBA|nr:piwi protein 3 [Pleurobrachia bachei]
MLPGYEFTIRQYTGGTLLGLNISHKIVRTDTVLDVMNQIGIRANGPQLVTAGISMLLFCIRIDDIDFTIKPTDTVIVGRRGETTYVQYYQDVYNITLRDLNQPLLVSRVKKRSQGAEGGFIEVCVGALPALSLILSLSISLSLYLYLSISHSRSLLSTHTMKDAIVFIQFAIYQSQSFKITQYYPTRVLIRIPPEVCHMTGITDGMRSNPAVMRSIADRTRQNPTNRHTALNGFMDTVRASGEAMEELEAWGVEVPSEVLPVTGRQIAPTRLLLKTGQVNVDPARANFDRITRQQFVLSSADIGNDYTVICEVGDRPKAAAFMDAAFRVGPGCGINIGNGGSIIELVNNGSFNIVCILATDSKDKYDAIKKHCCIERPIPSQVILKRTLSNPARMLSVVTKIVMQMNAKMGGELWGVHIPMQNVMYVGIDTYHDSGSSRSVGGVVASMNSCLTKFYHRTTWQPNRQELISQMDVVMTDLLRAYKTRNNDLPDRIFVFRDGVGDGQLLAVREQELRNIKDAIARAEIATDKNPHNYVVLTVGEISALTGLLWKGGRTLVLTDSLSKFKADSISKNGLFIYKVQQTLVSGLTAEISRSLRMADSIISNIKSPPCVDFLDIESALYRLFRHRVPWYILAPNPPNRTLSGGWVIQWKIVPRDSVVLCE